MQHNHITTKQAGTTFVVMLAVAVATVLITVSFVSWMGASKSTPSTAISNPEKSFLTMCSGVSTTTDEAMQIAYANCMGRVRGVVDGHLVAAAANSSIPQLWCVDAETTDALVYGQVIAWIHDSPTEYAKITDYFDPSTATMMVVMSAISDKFPCNHD